jgi:hypothetical protein
MELEEICGTNESMEEHGKDTTGSQGARVWDQQQEEAKGELRELFGTEFPNFQKGDGMDKLEVDDEIPTCLAINVTVKGGGRARQWSIREHSQYGCVRQYSRKLGLCPKFLEAARAPRMDERCRFWKGTDAVVSTWSMFRGAAEIMRVLAAGGYPLESSFRSSTGCC